ncbi:MAG: GNAT family N-acetyltransferase [Actinomycetes bacterium]
MANSITLRTVTPEDQDLLFRVFSSTRVDELALTDWDQGQIHEFLHMQFRAQSQHYQNTFPHASYDIVQNDGRAVGRLSIDRNPVEIRILDIALLPEARGRGIGTALLRSLLAEGEFGGTPIRIHVEKFNPALRWYQRLGFELVSDTGVYLAMEWNHLSPRMPQ